MLGGFFNIVSVGVVSFHFSAVIDIMTGSSWWDKAWSVNVHKFFLGVSFGDMV